MGRSSRRRGSAANREPGRGRLPSGVPGLDVILDGGFLTGALYAVVGAPGTGKTVLANQVCFEHARAGGRCLYVTLLSETHSRLVRNLEPLGFFDEALVDQGVAYTSGVHALARGGYEALLDLVRQETRRRRASLLILDGHRVAERVVGADPGDGGTFVNHLVAFLELLDCTALLCTVPGGLAPPEQALADGILELRHVEVGRRALRELYVSKYRGGMVLEGAHLFEIDRRGVVVYPRTEARLARAGAVPGPAGERLRFGVPRLDEMLGGGVPAASTTALIGPTGAGKTLLGLHFLAEGARRGDRGLYLGFYESPDRVRAEGDGVGIGLSRLVEQGLVELAWRRPVETLIDRVTQEMLALVDERSVRRLFIDGVEGLARGAVQPERATIVLAAVANALRDRGVGTVVSIEGGLFGGTLAPEEPWSALVENTIVLRYVEVRSHLHRLLWVVKVRGSDFDSSLREFSIGGDGFRLADTFESAEALLSGFARMDHELDPLRGGSG